MSARDQLATFVKPDVLELVDRYVDERIAAALAEHHAAAPSNGETDWITLERAAELLDCTPDAVRMRAKRGRLTTRHHGRRVYVSRRSVEELQAT